MAVSRQTQGSTPGCGGGANVPVSASAGSGVATHHPAHAPALLCDPPAGVGDRHAHDPGAVGTSSARDHVGLHPRDHDGIQASGQSAGHAAGAGAGPSPTNLDAGPTVVRQFLPAYVQRYPAHAGRGAARLEPPGVLPHTGLGRTCAGMHALRRSHLSLPFVRRSALSRLRRHETGGLAGATAERLAAGAVLSCGVHAAARIQRFGAGQPQDFVRSPVRGHTGDALDHRRRLAASGSAAGSALGAAHMGPTVGASSTYPCGGPRRRVVAGRGQVGGEPGGLLGIGGCAGPAVPRQVPGRLAARLYDAGELQFAGSTEALKEKRVFQRS